MTNATQQQTEPAPIVACTISRDVQNFDLLIDDMEALLGEGWGDLGFDEATAFLNQPDGRSLEFVAMAIDAIDEPDLPMLSQVIHAAKENGVKVILIAEDVTPASLHHLLRDGADEFVPYPLPEGELAGALERLRQPAPAAVHSEPAPATNAEGVRLSGGGDGVLIAVHGLAGGVGATTLAVNLAYELATGGKEKQPKVCLIDLGLQFGSVSTYLDLPRREAVYETLSDIEAMDGDSFGQALVSFEDKMQVFTAPSDILPLDIIGPAEIKRLLDITREHFDYVIVDMPSTVVQWTETVLTEAQLYFALIELDMRSAQNTLRLKRALQSEDLPFEKIRFALNRAPKFTDLQGKSRVKRLADSLAISLDVQLPDGGRTVMQACDHGLPLASHAAKNPLRREIVKLAQQLNAIGDSDAEAA
ncbi:pilus assembly protein CpaE [Mameliella alba]|uniref:AAA family ATPase n=1 Tax=Mameliella alba TaxID=561184 RepID=UPI00088CE2E2|nr:AAA family ATPase [Mameliella alba]OWV48342.1 pilus assembly protein CpaE [Mameliella alba]PTR40389.1 pilus assembly protein CpaE [Mameliella alba]GGF44613.1 pilus assembly protein CpaE [Mameliella alba]SDD01383.1 pilus assembly protein CpaE [Mameliella alba]